MSARDGVCFACGRVADTRDAQVVFVGRDCYRAIEAAGEPGYQPPLGGRGYGSSVEQRRPRRRLIFLFPVVENRIDKEYA